MDKETLRIQEF